MRLIDADTLIDEIKSQVNEFCIDDSKSSEFTAFVGRKMIELVNRMPTAYDIEAVCRKLLLESEGICGYDMVSLNIAEEIVRSGGIQ